MEIDGFAFGESLFASRNSAGQVPKKQAKRVRFLPPMAGQGIQEFTLSYQGILVR
jgi:hypothetical protein